MVSGRVGSAEQSECGGAGGDAGAGARGLGRARGGRARFWLWLAADNLKLAALNAIACATELRRLRPSGKVQ